MDFQNTSLSSTQVSDNWSIYDLPTQKIASIRSPERASSQQMRTWHWILFTGVLALSAFLNFFHSQQNGYGNNYYAAAVKSMLMNWHNFFFVSFDPGGFISVDKPPVALWLQTLSAKLFGFSGFSLFLPQALAGVLAVAVLFCIVRRSFGPLPALLAALIMAITPVGVVMSRDNNLDMMLVLVVLLATWAVLRAAEAGSLKWLLLGAALLGIGFNVKMLEAYLVVPALGLLYLLAAPRTWWWRAAHLALALVILLVISFSWITVVDLTPASQRPYVGSSQTNSELELALGYNGIARLFHFGGEQKAQPDHVERTPSASMLFLLHPFASDPQKNTDEATSDSPGALRLFIQPLADQISWLLPLALLSMLALAWQRRWRGSLDAHQRALLLWGTWLLTMLIAFSIADHFLTYYTVMMAPAISALAGIGLSTLWHDYSARTSGKWSGWLLPLALLLTGIFQTTLLAAYPGWSSWLSPLIISLAALAGILLVVVLILTRPQRAYSNLVRVAAALGIFAILAAPFVWSTVSLTYPANGSDPTAGPRQPDFAAVFHEHFYSSTTYVLNKNQQKLLSYLLAHRGSTQFLLGTLNASMAIPFILVTGQPVMALGGFTASDPVLTTAQLATDVENGTVRFFLLPFDIKTYKHTTKLTPTGGNSALVRWVAAHCTAVPPQEWEPGHMVVEVGKPDEFHPSDNLQHIGNSVVTTLLYDCGNPSP